MDPEARRLPMFPLSTVLYPSCPLPLHVFEERYRRLVADCLGEAGHGGGGRGGIGGGGGGGHFGVVLIARGPEVGGGDERFGVATEAVIEEAEPLPDGRWYLLCRGRRRIRVVRWLDDDPYPLAEVVDVPGASGPSEVAERTAGRRVEAEAAVRRVRALLSEWGEVPALAPGHVFGGDDEDAGWALCTAVPLPVLDRQRLLEAPTTAERLTLLTSLVGELEEDVRRMLSGS